MRMTNADDRISTQDMGGKSIETIIVTKCEQFHLKCIDRNE